MHEAHAQTQDAHFRAIFDDLPALVCLLKPEGGVELVNRCCMTFFGATCEEMATWTLADVIHPDDLAAVSAAWERAVATGSTYEVEGRHRRADGVYRWLHMSARPLTERSGRILFWYLVQTDIDERKRAEQLLAGERRVLEMVAADVPLPEVLDALCTLVEESVEGAHCGMLFADATGRTWRHAAGPGLPTGYRNAMEGRPADADSGPCGLASRSGAPVIVHDVAGDARWVPRGWQALALHHGLTACWSVPIVSRGGASLGALAIYRNTPGSPEPAQLDLIGRVSHIASIAVERSQHDAALRQSEAFLAQAQRISSTGGFSWHTVTDRITWSDQVYRIFDADRAQPVTLASIVARLHPEDAPAFAEMLQVRRRDGGDFEHEHRLLMGDGSIKYVHVVAHATRDRDGQLEYIAAVQDVTQRRRSEEALGEVRLELAHVARIAALNAMTASIAHEVNQPLAGIVTNAGTCLRMLAADPPNIEGARATALRTVRDGNRAADVIARLRALFSNRATASEPVDLNEATREVIALMLAELRRGRVVVRAELAQDLPPVLSDRVQLQQVIMNLLLNASDAMSAIEDRPRRVIVSTGRDRGDHVRLAVQDVGVGLRSAEVERLFDPFYTTKSSGMGIGLSISRSIIESHNGRLWAEPNDGPGATFVFSIPRDPQDPGRAGGGAPPSRATPIAGSA